MNDENKGVGARQAEDTAAEQPTQQSATAPAKEQKPKAEAKPKTAGKQASNSALKAAGAAACKRHGLAEVWVTNDGQAFPQQGDAKAHAANLSNKEILKVTK